VMILGEVNQPGSYMVTSLYRATDLIRLASGINRIGSFHIKIKSSDGKERTIDYFKIMILGDRSSDISLRPGDELFVPARKEMLTADGQFRHPGEFDYSGGITVKEFIDQTGGLTCNAALKEAWITRRDPVNYKESIIKLDLTDINDLSAKLNPDDKLTVPDMALFRQYVILSGEFQNPPNYSDKTIANNEIAVRTQSINKKWFYPYKKGEKIYDVIKSVSGYTERADLYKAQVIRSNKEGDKEIILLNLYALMNFNDQTQNIELLPGDEFIIPVFTDRVFIGGMVKNPGAFPYISSRSMKDYIMMAGGPQEYANINYIKILRGNSKNPKLLTYNLSMTLKGESQQEVMILPGDIIYFDKSEFVSYKDIIYLLSSLINLYALTKIFQPTN